MRDIVKFISKVAGLHTHSRTASKRLIDSLVDASKSNFPRRVSRARRRSKNKVTIVMIHLSRYARIITSLRHDKAHSSLVRLA